jgi:hypothetical protein
MIDKKILVDRLLGAENITDNLEDEDAKYLLDWGVSQVDVVIIGIDDKESADQRATYLMHVMRAINRIAGDWPGLEPDQLAELLENYAGAYAARLPAAGVNYQSAVSAVADMNIRQAIEYLINWCSSQK